MPTCFSGGHYLTLLYILKIEALNLVKKLSMKYSKFDNQKDPSIKFLLDFNVFGIIVMLYY